MGTGGCQACTITISDKQHEIEISTWELQHKNPEILKKWQRRQITHDKDKTDEEIKEELHLQENCQRESLIKVRSMPPIELNA